MLNCDYPAIREAAPISRAIDFVDDGRVHVTAAQEIGVQRVGDAAFDGVLCRGQRLTQDLPAEYLWSTDIAAVAAKNVVFDPLELQ